MLRVLTLAAIMLAVGMGAEAEGAFSEGRWRLEVSAHSGLSVGNFDRSGDLMALTTVEYEIPLSGHVTAGLKLHPVFTYEQDELDVDDLFDADVLEAVRKLEFDFSRDVGGDSVWGAGIGAGVRIYQVKTEHRGLFLDLGVSALFHEGQLNRDSSNVDFLSGVGVGYQFNFGLNAKLSYSHVSNAGLGDENAGSNLLGIGLGFRF